MKASASHRRGDAELVVEGVVEEPVAGLGDQPGEGDLAGGGIGEGFLEIEVRGGEGQREEEGDESFSHGGDVGKR